MNNENIESQGNEYVGETLRVGKSFTTKRPDLSKYAARLRALDQNGDGQLSIDAVCGAIDQVIQAEKHERFFKWVAILAAVVALLAVAASAGLTYAVVALTKDIQVQNNVLVSKDTGAALQTQNSDMQVSDTGALLNRQGTGPVGTSSVYEDLTMAEVMQQLEGSDISSQEVQNMLAEIETVMVPSADPASPYSVWKVAEVAPLEGGKIVVRSIAGNSVTFNTDGSAEVLAVDGTNRKLLAVGAVTNVRRKPAVTALPGGLSRWRDVWYARNGDSKCSDRAPVVADGACVPCYSAVGTGSSCWPGLKGAETVVCTVIGICVNTRDRFFASEDGKNVATDLICSSMYDFATGTLIPTKEPAAGARLPCFGCTEKVAAGEKCWESGTSGAAYTCQDNGKCQLVNKKKSF